MLIAPPLVLGRLRDLLTSTTRMKLVREITRDMTDDTTDSIKTLLQNGKA
jgi:protein required for attachment to host cells